MSDLAFALRSNAVRIGVEASNVGNYPHCFPLFARRSRPPSADVLSGAPPTPPPPPGGRGAGKSQPTHRRHGQLDAKDSRPAPTDRARAPRRGEPIPWRVDEDIHQAHDGTSAAIACAAGGDRQRTEEHYRPRGSG